MTSRTQTATSSRYVLEGGRPRFARRFAPVNANDSGWCFLDGHPDEDAPDYGDVPANFRRTTIADLLDHFPELAQILDAPVDSTFEWDDDGASYRLAYGD